MPRLRGLTLQRPENTESNVDGNIGSKSAAAAAVVGGDGGDSHGADAVEGEEQEQAEEGEDDGDDEPRISHPNALHDACGAPSQW